MTAVDSGFAKITEQVERLTKEAVKAPKPEVVQLPGEPPETYALWDSTQKNLTRCVAAAHPREYTAGSPIDLAQIVNEFQTRSSDAVCFVFAMQGNVVAVLDEKGTRRERVKLGLTMSPSFKALRDHANTWFTQSAFVSFLRTELNAKYNPDRLISIVRKLKFTSGTKAESEIKTGKASLGKQVEAAVAGLDGASLESIEDVDVTLPIYVDLFESEVQYVAEFNVKCSLDFDLGEEKFRLRPKAGELERVLLEADKRLLSEIKTNVASIERVRFYRGRPN